MRRVVALVLAVLAPPPAGAAGDGPGDVRGEARGRVSYDVGALVALGGQANLLDDAVLVGLTGTYEVSPWFAVVAAVSGARRDSGGAWEGEQILLQYDAGAQAQLRLAAGAETAVMPFVGVGLGARTRDDTDVGRGVDTDLTGYLALGGTVEHGMGLVTLTAKDLVSAPQGPWTAHLRTARHDLAVVASFGVRF